MTIISEDAIVAIPPGEDELLGLRRALPPTEEDSMVLAIESPASPNSMFLIFSLQFSRFFSYIFLLLI